MRLREGLVRAVRRSKSRSNRCLWLERHWVDASGVYVVFSLHLLARVVTCLILAGRARLVTRIV